MEVVNKLQFGHFKAAVKIGEKLARCYAVSVHKRKKEVTCWIASELGQEFAVCLEKEETPYHCCPHLFLDGKKLTFKPLEKSHVGDITLQFVTTSKTTMRPFVFGDLSVTDNEALVDALLLKNSTAGNLGEIRISIHRAVHLVREKVRKESWDSEESDSESSDYSEDHDESDIDSADDQENKTDSGKKPPENQAESVPEIRMVHESSTKVTSIPHQIKFGEKIIVESHVPKEAPLRAPGRPNVLERVRAEASKPSVVTKPTKPKVVSCREVKERLVTFVFNYRPIETLRENGVVLVVPPLSVSQSPADLVAAAAPDSAALPEVHSGLISLLQGDVINEERDSLQLPSHADDTPTSGAPHVVEECETPSAPEPAANDSNPALATPTESAPYPPMRLPTPEEEKPKITPMISITAEEEDINSQIKQLQLQLDEIKNKKRQIEEASNTTSKRVKIENVQHFLPGETIDLLLDA
ncbi:hypothetical protein HYPSUDRAFT_207264 [Hypholoma sublateritium FD-334 SS-4]|uniref:DUF7918 domain-containing protein n=1 Tax=Hypholoma sublateritium (strain FD-334 SS-4) TaxID=945553 RepID=A0A0D2LZA9_HYPSF|nr:hypothetical protein HYPSUDRAFT_207264 [Hypholoma sublateritium FD-334 SS-4]